VGAASVLLQERNWRQPFIALTPIIRWSEAYAAVARFEDAHRDLWLYADVGAVGSPTVTKWEDDQLSDLLVEWDAAQLAFEDAMRAELGGRPASLKGRRIRHS